MTSTKKPIIDRIEDVLSVCFLRAVSFYSSKKLSTTLGVPFIHVNPKIDMTLPRDIPSISISGELSASDVLGRIILDLDPNDSARLRKTNFIHMNPRWFNIINSAGHEVSHLYHQKFNPNIHAHLVQDIKFRRRLGSFNSSLLRGMSLDQLANSQEIEDAFLGISAQSQLSLALEAFAYSGQAFLGYTRHQLNSSKCMKTSGTEDELAFDIPLSEGEEELGHKLYSVKDIVVSPKSLRDFNDSVRKSTSLEEEIEDEETLKELKVALSMYTIDRLLKNRARLIALVYGEMLGLDFKNPFNVESSEVVNEEFGRVRLSYNIVPRLKIKRRLRERFWMSAEEIGGQALQVYQFFQANVERILQSERSKLENTI